MQVGRQQRGAVDHRGVHDLPAPGDGTLHEGGQHPEGEQQPAAAEVAEQVRRGKRGSPALTDRVQCARERDVVDVVPRGLGQRAVLAPAGHPAVDQAGVALQAGVRAEPEPLHDAGPEALDEHVGAVGESQHRVACGGVLEVGGHRGPAAAQQHLGIGGGELPGPVDADDVGAEVGQQHAGEGRRRQAGELQHPHAREGSVAHPPPPFFCRM